MQQNPMFMDQIAQNTQKLVQRIDELEDLVAELKTKQTASEVADLKELVSQLQLENAQFVKKIAWLQEARISSKELFQANDMHQSYLEIMREREKVIESLYAQIKRMNDNRMLKGASERLNLEPSFGKLNAQDTNVAAQNYPSANGSDRAVENYLK